MRTTSYTELRGDLAAELDRVTDDNELVIITRGRGKPAAVLMSIEDFAAYEEARHLLRNPHDADRLLKAVSLLAQRLSAEKPPIE